MTTFVLTFFGGMGVLIGFYVMTLRRVVPANQVHIVQRSKSTVPYGRDTQNGNTYYAWPAWLPHFGVTVSKLSTSVFDIDLQSYEAYDLDRLPFLVDIKAFFRVTDPSMAAERVTTGDELEKQLVAVVQGAARSILSSNKIQEILQGRATFGDQFTKEVQENLTQWGVGTVKNIELMDIRDAKGSNVIGAIMEKKKSEVDRDSRTTVAENMRAAEMAEIEAKKETALKKEDAMRETGIRAALREKEVALANEAKAQQVAEANKATVEKALAVELVRETKSAEIQKDVARVNAEEKKQAALIRAQQDLEVAQKLAEAELFKAEKGAEGIRLQGQAQADALKAKEMAPVAAQLELAKEIGSNQAYQQYLINLKAVEVQGEVGKAQAEALKMASIKVIANSGNANSGLNSVGELFSSVGGTQLGAMLEGFKNTEVGGKLVEKIVGKEDDKSSKVEGKTETVSDGKTVTVTPKPRPQIFN